MSSRLRCVAALACVATLLAAGVVHAGHYRLSRVNLVTKAERAALAKEGISTTRNLLAAVSTRRQRRALAQRTKIMKARLDKLATQCDLLRIRGVGPSMMRVLQAAKLYQVAHLRKLSASAVLAKMKAANSVHRIVRVLPGLPAVKGWVSEARRLKIVLKGIR